MARLLFRLLQEANPPSPAQASPALNSDLVLILAALLCALICVLGLIAVSRCAWLRRIVARNRSGETHSPPVAAANKGLKKKVLRSLPKLTYSPDSPPAEKLAECAICLTEFAAGDELRVLPQCGHGFHVSCIDTWLGSHSSCPSCRQILVVARCQKCGGLPGSSSSGSEPETRIKQHEEVDNSDNFLP
ncbi:RING-H2 finger protein ATL8 [Cardamine amara subsp. amara]|uniref:RING-type E3 ubiquitin transferase n=1 Tax=Cardamine amara subsp. amara TaxID=228776 RepID=A0ABD0Z5W8_CARAN